MDLIHNNIKYKLEFEIRDNQLSGKINDDSVGFNFRKVTNNMYSVFIDNSYKNIHVAENDTNYFVAFDGDNFIIDKVIEEEKSFSTDDSSNSDVEILKPPMPGSIVKVLVDKEQKVDEGEAIIIVEAMKMETTLYSSISGIVTEIKVSAGEQVDSNHELVIIEKENME